MTYEPGKEVKFFYAGRLRHGFIVCSPGPTHIVFVRVGNTFLSVHKAHVFEKNAEGLSPFET